MTKLSAIAVCRFLLILGFYAVPRLNPAYHDWEIVILHDVSEVGFDYSLDSLVTSCGLKFEDCIIGKGGQDFPVYFLKGG